MLHGFKYQPIHAKAVFLLNINVNKDECQPRTDQEQLKYIFDVCKKWDVEYVDLRLELVDHIASRISDIWEDEPDLPFKDAFHRVYKSFGIYGLHNIVEDHQKIMNRRYWQEFKNGIKVWITPPRVIATICLPAVLYSFFKLIPVSVAPMLLTTFLLVVVGAIVLALKSRNLSKHIEGERTMLLSTPRQFLWIVYFLFFVPFQPVYSHLIFAKETNADFLLTTPGMIFTSAIITISLITLAIHFRIMKLAEAQLDQVKIHLEGLNVDNHIRQ
jgi:hypothetical protein